MKPLNLKIYNNLDLVPDCWAGVDDDVQDSASPKWYVFNPTLVRIQDAYVMTYRVVDEVHKIRRIASCKLAGDLSIVPGSVTPLSDLIEFEGSARFTHRTLTWHADPRYFRLENDLYLLWNDGSVKPENHQFILKIGLDSLTPAGKARLVRKDPHEARIEKNWQFFDSPQGVYVIYENRPLQLLSTDLSGTDTVICRKANKIDWTTAYEEKFGQIRGGAQPVLYEGSLLTVAHSSYKNDHGELVYHPCFYRFESQLPFRVTHRPKGPFKFPVPGLDKARLPRLNKQIGEVVYPCGLVIDGEEAVVSFGVNDEACVVAVLHIADILASMESVDASDSRNNCSDLARVTSNTPPPHSDEGEIPLFWWDALGKRFDPSVGGRFFATGNVGDIASKLLVEKLCGVQCRPARKNEHKLLSIGSILQNAAEGDVVWGSGIKGTIGAFKQPVRNLSVHAVRGPLTVDFLRRQGIALLDLKELFDPGCLIPHLYADELSKAIPRKRKLCIIPHYKDYLVLKKQHPELTDAFLSVDAMPLDFIKDMLGAELVVSSSLHGLIFAEALGIPALWLAPINGEDELKYYDYYYGTGRYRVKRFTTVGSALRAEPMELPHFRFNDYLRTFPQDAISGLCPTRPQTSAPQWSFASATAADTFEHMVHNRKFATPASRCTTRHVSQGAQRPPSLHLTEAIAALRDRRVSHGLPALCRAAAGARALNDVSLGLIVQRVAQLYLGFQDFSSVTERLGSKALDLSAPKLLMHAFSEALHRSSPQEVPRTLAGVIAQQAGAAINEESLPWKLLLAFTYGRQGKEEQESRLLKTASKANPEAFWHCVQQVYRFSTDLQSLNLRACGIRPQPDKLADERGPLRLFCYPSFNQINSYQTLLYSGLEASGEPVVYCRKFSELDALKAVPGRTNLLHVHWVSAFFEHVGPEGFERRALQVLALLSRLKAAGFSLAWTIHNSISHDSVNPEQEALFNRKLYSLCDWVFVHHPLVVQFLDWLPHPKKLCLVEHGSYGRPDHTDRSTARRKLGISFDGPLISTIGHMRDYKDIHLCLPHVVKVLNKHPDARFLLAGKIHAPVLRQLLDEKKPEQVMVMDRTLSAEELHLCMDATDVGLLSYRDILTSGSLLHWLSRGVPVVAPAKGTIPGYVIEGWNGFLYDDFDALAGLLQFCLTMETSHLAMLKENALVAGNSMLWRFT